MAGESSESSEEPGDILTATIKYPEYDSIAPSYCNNMVVQATPDGFILSFYVVLPPMMVTATPEERFAAMKAITHVPATCVAKVLVPMSQMEKVVEALKTNLERVRARQEKE